MPKEGGKSFKKFAKGHLHKVIENRRTSAKSRKEKKERKEKAERKRDKEHQKEEAEHRADLDNLKDADPEFYSFLEEEDPTLLQYGDIDDDAVDQAFDENGSDADTETDADEDNDDDGEGADDDGELEGENDDAAEARPTRVNRAELNAIIQSKNAEQAVDLLLSAARELGTDIRIGRRASSMRKFDDPNLVKPCIVEVAAFVAKNIATAVVTRQGKQQFKNQQSRDTVRRLLDALINLVKDATDDAKFIDELSKSASLLVGVMRMIPGVTKTAIRAALNLATNQRIEIRASGLRILTAIARRAAGTRSMYQSALFKGVFLTLVRTAQRVTIHTLPIIASMMNTLTSIYGTDLEAAYQHCYVYVRQLAIYLRAALQQQSQSNIRMVFNWQYIMSLRCWGLLVASYPSQGELGPLIHPLVQIATGVMDLFASPRMFPMHLHVIEVLNRISLHGNVYVPVSSYLLRILTSPSLAIDAAAARKGQHGSHDQGGGQTDLQFTLRVKKTEAKQTQYRVNVWLETLYLLTEHLAAHCHSIGFPEVFWAVTSTLTKLRRDTKVPRVHSLLTNVLQSINSTSQTIIAKREHVTFGPCDTVQVKMFEDQLKSLPKPCAIAALFQSMRKQRVEAFDAKQRKVREQDGGANNKPKRRMLEEKAAGKKRERSGDADDE